MPLEEYERKRDFAKTPEPGPQPGAEHSAARRAFVVQKHAASRLHYDFRLELDGVLLSWAVPKGPSFDPRDKRLAVHVEDHPLDYAGFEGTIPKGEYGGGTVIVWDRGWWEPLGGADPHALLAKGDFKFVLHGEKLVGRWVLVRMKPRPNDHAENWLLIKERDEEARPSDDFDVEKELPASVASGLTVEQVAEAASGGGASAGAPEPEAPAPKPARRTSANPRPVADEPAVAHIPLPSGTDPMPADAPMQLATLVEAPPAGEGWIHEAKYDGYRIRALLESGKTRLLTRSGQDWTETFAEVARAVESLPMSSAMLDGEVVVLNARGLSDFGMLQEAISEKRTGRVSYVAFDLLYLDGHDVREQPLITRKDLLKTLLTGLPAASVLRYAEHVTESAGDFYRNACAHELEGVVSKRANRPWVGGRTPDWLKVKCAMRQEFAIGGFTEPGGSREGFGALLLGVYDEAGALRYAGRVGTGFTERMLQDLRVQLEGLAAETSPFATPPRLADHVVHWVRPELVAEVAFREWTREGHVRQPSYRGLRGDKLASDVARETPQATESPPAADTATADASGARPRPRSHRGAFGADVVVSGVRLTNPEKLLFDESPLTKLDLARYYEQVAEHMLPHVAGRPLTIVRCPTGNGRHCFYQKHPDDGLPEAVHTVTLKERAGSDLYMYIENLAGLISLVQMGVGEIHTWGSTVERPEQPERIIFDLDPGPGVGWRRVADAALEARDRLAAAGIASFAKATGGHGLHVVVPIEPVMPFDEARAWARSFAETLAAEDPKRLTTKMAKDLRPGRIFIDYLRNSHGATAIAPYSTRARPGAPVSIPLEWSELGADRDVRQLKTRAVLHRLETQARDPWTGIADAAASVETLRAALEG